MPLPEERFPIVSDYCFVPVFCSARSASGFKQQFGGMYTHSSIGGFCCYIALQSPFASASTTGSQPTNPASPVVCLVRVPPPPHPSSESGAVGNSRINNIDNNSSGSSVCRNQRKPCFRSGNSSSGTSTGGGGGATRGSRVLAWSRRVGLAICLAWLLCLAVREFYVRTYCLQVSVCSGQRSRLSEHLGFCLFFLHGHATSGVVVML